MFSRILLVEDHADTANACSLLLCIEGYYVRIAGGCEPALALAAHDHFHLVVCDIGLPDGSGLDLMRALASQYEMKGVAFTGYGTAQDIADCEAAGFSAHVLKPAPFEKLKSAIEKCLLPDGAVVEI